MSSPHSFPPARAIGPGAHLRIVAPAGPFDRDRFDLGVAWLRERYRVSFSGEIYGRTGYFAGSDERRLAELNEAILDPDVDAILAARGGFGCTRILPGVDREAIGEANKTIIGFSDITALHALWAAAGVRSIHAPMVAALGKASAEAREAWAASVENQDEHTRWDLEVLGPDNPTSAEGRFFGGNLAVLASLCGTPYAPPLGECVLFLEDVGERPYRIDRMLTTLRQSGWFGEISGLVLGAFTDGEPGEDGVSVDDVLRNHFGEAPFPVLGGMPAGHIDENQPISFGGKATIREGALELIH